MRALLILSSILFLFFSINSYAATNWAPDSLIGTDNANPYWQESVCELEHGSCTAYDTNSEDAALGYKKLNIFGSIVDDDDKKAAWQAKKDQRQAEKDAKAARKLRYKNAKDIGAMSQAEKDTLLQDLLDSRKD